ncbi:MAG: 50S ribosomal protein L25 [Candidatus Peregrinibacteria bacterium]
MVPLKASARDLKVSPGDIRRSNAVPCVIYGNDVANTALSCVANEITKAYTKAGESTIVELELGDKKIPVLFHAVQFEPVSGRIHHVDFYAVNLKKEIEAPVALRFTGESLAVKELSAIFVSVQSHVTVRALPMDLPHDLEAPLSVLAKIHDVIKVSDLILPKGVQVKDQADTVLATVQEQRKEEVVVVAAPVVGAEGAAPVAGAEGAAPADAAKAGAPAEAAAGKGDKKKAKKD